VVTPVEVGRHFNAKPQTTWAVKLKPKAKPFRGSVHIERVNMDENNAKPVTVDLQISSAPKKVEFVTVELDSNLKGVQGFEAEEAGKVRSFNISFDGTKMTKGGIDAVFSNAADATEEDDSVGSDEASLVGVVNMRELGQHFLCSDKTSWGVRGEDKKFLLGFTLHSVAHKLPTPTPTVPKDVPTGLTFSVISAIGQASEPITVQLDEKSLSYVHAVEVNGVKYQIVFDGLTAVKLGIKGLDARIERAGAAGTGSSTGAIRKIK